MAFHRSTTPRSSDPSYFNDFDNSSGSSTDGYATQKFSVGYAVQNFNATVSTSGSRFSAKNRTPVATRQTAVRR
ncbi:LPS assembly protein LptD [Shigella flexneri]